MRAACWHNFYSRISCSWQIENCFVSEINKTSWCFEIMFWLLGSVLEWGVGGNCSVPWSWKEVAQRSPERQWHWSGSSVLSRSVTCCCCSCSGGSLVLVQAGISLLGSGSWLTRRCCIYVYKSKSSLSDSGCFQARIVEATVTWYPAAITMAFIQANWMATKTSHGTLIFVRNGTHIKSWNMYYFLSASLIVTGPFIKYFSAYLNFPIHAWAFLGSQFLF